MNKEILDDTLEYLEGIDETRNVKILTTNETNILLDYIFNLQKENERLKENAIHNDKVVDKVKWNEMLNKSRIEKALKYIEKVETFAMIDKINILSITTLKKILQGVGEDYE